MLMPRGRTERKQCTRDRKWRGNWTGRVGPAEPHPNVGPVGTLMMVVPKVLGRMRALDWWECGALIRVEVSCCASCHGGRGRGQECLGQGFSQKMMKDGYFDVKGKTDILADQLLKLSFTTPYFLYRVTEDSLMECLNTNTHEACLQIDKDCR
nr:hypothetical protein [Tanacetum cinerariifolium]